MYVRVKKQNDYTEWLFFVHNLFCAICTYNLLVTLLVLK